MKYRLGGRPDDSGGAGRAGISQWRFQCTLRERVADILQPDLFYYGGLIRSIRVARMAALRDLPTTPHLSGGFGFVYLLHLRSEDDEGGKSALVG